MAKSKRSKTSNIFVWIILGLLVVGLMGFGIGGVGRGGNQIIGSVGDEEITVSSYAQALNNELRQVSQRFGQNITLEQARAFGLDRQVVGRLITTAALDEETASLGVSVGDDRVRDQLLATQAFQGLNGSFDQTAYEYALSQAGMTPADYDAVVRKQDSRDLLQVAVVGGIKTSPVFAETLFAFLGEGRNFSWAMINSDGSAEFLPIPSEEQLTEYYTANPEEFTAPQTRKLTYVQLTPDMLLDKIKAEEEELKRLYDEQPERFNKPERRIVERLVFSTLEEATAGLASLNDGATDFEALVQSRGLELQDIDLGDVAKSSLSPAAGEAVFFLSEPGIVGPVESTLGPALFRVNAILDAQITPFEDALAELSQELVADEARRQIANSITDIDDLLAGGATLEDLAAETDMELKTLDYTAEREDGIAAYEGFRTEAAAIAIGDFPEVRELSDGGIFALRLDSIIEPTLIPLDEVRDLAISGWQQELLRENLLKRVDDLKAKLSAGDSLADLGLSPRDEENIRRDTFLDEAPVTMVSDLFKAEIDEVISVVGQNGIALVRVTAVVPFDKDTAENALVLESLSSQFNQQLELDVFQAYATALQQNADITLNQPMIDAVHRQFGQPAAPGGHN